jgi:glycosyltransferase involved in cell wall biosynthesis
VSSPLRIAVYGEINMNLIDGSSVWLQSLAQTLTCVDDTEVTVLLSFPEEREVLINQLRSSARIEVVEPRDIGHVGPLDASQALSGLERLDLDRRFDLLLLRGSRICEEACERPALAGRLWLYFLPSYAGRAEETAARLRTMAPRADRILCQTEALRESAADVIPNHVEKLILLPPMIPPPPAGRPSRSSQGPLRLIYAGKFAPEYQFLEMVSLFESLRRELPESRFDVVGDKIHDPPADPGFKAAAEEALAKTENLVWHGGVSRSETQELLRAADVALSVRHPAMLHSRELSTKVLESGAAGCAVVLSRTPIYEQLLGADYPLFVREPVDALDALLRLGHEPGLRSAAAERCERASRQYSFERVAAGLEPHLRQRRKRARHSSTAKLVIAGHDLRFVGPVRSALDPLGISVREDVWEAHTKHSVSESRSLLGWADVVLCEWCLGNAVWYSRNAEPEMRLVIRLHRVENESEYPAEVDSDRVDAWVFVAEHIMDEAVRRFALPTDKVRVIPNLVELGRFGSQKLPGATFNLGMVGFVDSRKRLDLALDVVERLRAADPRFRLIVKGKPPWEFPWVWQREEERRYYERVYKRMARSPLLREAVTFDPFGPDVPAFLDKVRFLVSTSDSEGDQVAVAEAAASGAIPVVLERPGAAEQYPPSWVHDSPDAAAGAILDVVYGHRIEAESSRALEFAKGRWSHQNVAPLWAEALGLSVERAPEPAAVS